MNIVPPGDLQRLLAEEPFVRLLAHTLLAEEADEVVQQTWLHAMRAGGGVAEPRSWLARIAWNVAHNLRRSRRRRERHERDGIDAPVAVPSSAELLEREERRRQLVEAVDRLPPHLRAAVLLRYFEGLPPRRIASQLGLSVTAVWNQLRRALQLLREDLDGRHGGDRRAWLLPLVPLAGGAPGGPSPSPVPGGPGSEGLVVPKAKVVAVAAMLLASAGGITLWAAASCVNAPEPAAGGGVTASPAPPDAPPDAPADAGQPAVEALRTPVPLGGTAGGAALVVHLRHGDKTAAADVGVLVMPVRGDRRVDALRRRTDAKGEARFDGLPAGRFHVATDRCDVGKLVVTDGTKATELEYELPVGMTLKGLVVDRTGAPVANASLDLAPLGNTDIDAEVVAATGADGRFVVRVAETHAYLGARATGHASSLLQSVTGAAGETVELRVQLGAPAGTVSGTVVDADDRPVPRAILRIGAGQACGFNAVAGHPPAPATVHTDDEGKFVAVGINPGTQPVVARAAATAPWRGTCEVTANGTTTLRVQLGRGATIRGTVRDAAGAPVAGATVEVGDMLDVAHFVAATSADGAYELTGLAAGDIQVLVRHETAGRAERVVATTAGTAARGDLQLASGPQLRGRVVDETGAAVAKAALECRAFGKGIPQGMWLQRVRSDAEGNFVVPNCPVGARLTVEVRTSGIEPLTRSDVDPGAGPLELRVKHAVAASVTIRGMVADSTGKPLANVRVMADDGKGSRDPSLTKSTGPDGRFEFGPLPPGEWRVFAATPLHPTAARGPKELAANATWDVETVQLVEGGTVRALAEGDLADVVFVVVDAAGHSAGSFSNNGPTPLVSRPLAPGAYHLAVLAKTLTADAAPFSVEAGKQTTVSLQLRAGVRQQVDVVADALASPPQGATLRVHRGKDLVTVSTCSFRESKRATKELCLPPGEYRIAVFDGDRQLATAEVRVAATESAPVRIELR